LVIEYLPNTYSGGNLNQLTMDFQALQLMPKAIDFNYLNNKNIYP